MNRDDRYIAVTTDVWLDLSEVSLDAVRAGGPGGQNVNKVSSAIHLRFDVRRSSLPPALREALLSRADKRINSDGVIIIKAQRHRTQAQNRQDALDRLIAMLRAAAHRPARRIATRPTRASKERRLKKKGINSTNKALRRKPQVE